MSTVHEIEKEGDQKKKRFQTRTARGRNITKDPKLTSEYGQFFMVNTTGKKYKLNKKGRNKNDRT